MSRARFFNLFIIFAMTFISTNSHAFFEPPHGGDPDALKKYGKSPHKADGDCSICHVASKEDLTSWFTFSSTKKKLITDPVTLCTKCHGSGFGHGTGKKPDINKTSLPLNNDGTITCAVTCHNMHITEFKDKAQEQYYLRYDNVKLCTSCHDK